MSLGFPPLRLTILAPYSPIDEDLMEVIDQIQETLTEFPHLHFYMKVNYRAIYAPGLMNRVTRGGHVLAPFMDRYRSDGSCCRAFLRGYT